MAIMGFLAVANAYTMRVCLNIAITQMVRRRAASPLDSESCPAVDVENEVSDAKVLTYVLLTSHHHQGRHYLLYKTNDQPKAFTSRY